MRIRSTYALWALMLTGLSGCGGDDRAADPAVAAARNALIMAPGWVAGSGWPSETVVALNSFHIQQDSLVVGNAATILSSPGPWLANDSEGVLGPGAELRGNLRADSVFMREGARVLGTAAYNEVTQRGVIDGAVTTTLALPLSITAPTIANFTAGTTAVDVSPGTTQTLSAGSRSTVLLRAATAPATTILRLSGGTYNWQSLNLNNRTRVECSAACTIRIKGRISPGERSYIGPTPGSGLAISAVQVIVEGENVNPVPSDSQPAVAIGEDSELKAYVFVPNGTLHLRAGSQSVGKFLAKDVRIGSDADVQDGSSSVALPQAWITGPSWPNEVITAYNSVDLGASIQITGDVSVATAATGPVLSTGFEFSLQSNGVVTGNVRGDTAIVRSGAQVTGSVSHNSFTNQGLPPGSVSTPLTLPLLLPVPAFPNYTAGTTTVTVPAQADQTLAAGSFGQVTLNAGIATDKTVLTLSGGVYVMSGLSLGTHSRLECAAACEIRVKNRISSGTNVFVGPVGSLDLGQLRVFVQGANGGSNPTSTPFAAVFGQNSEVRALVFAPNGTLNLGTGIVAHGRFVGRDVLASGGTIQQAGTTVTPPVISVQPENVTVVEGQAATFHVTAGGPSITYQWQRNGLNIAGATDSNYTLSTTTLSDDGALFRVVMTTAGGTVTSTEVTLTVTSAAPVITQHPTPATATEGQSASFTCAASGLSPSYQWQRNGEDIAGATSATYAIAMVGIGHAGDYRCVATIGANSVTSNAAALTVNLVPPAITQHPEDLTRNEGQGASFTCGASGTQVGYQWQHNGVNIEGATSQTYSISSVSVASAGAYRCVASNGSGPPNGGTATSDAATLTVLLNPPVITQHPADLTRTEEQSASFSCAASGTDVSYRWQKDGFDISGAVGQTYTIASVSAADAGAYRCVASNGSGAPNGGSAASNAAILTVQLNPPAFFEHPANLTRTEEQSASFSCQASGTDVSYRWQKDGADIAGALGATFTIGSVAYGDAGQYRCVAQNSGGSATSNPATLTVNLKPPVFELEPLDMTVNEGADATFTCDARGTLVTYAWTKGGIAIAGATSATYTVQDAEVEDEGAYRCVASNSGGTITSAPATLNVVLGAPGITQHPASLEVTEGQSASFTCAASGTGVTYRWQKNGGDIPQATGQTYAIAEVEQDDAGSYRCVATNATASATSNAATLTVNLIAPAIDLHPVSLVRTEGQSAGFSCHASGTDVTYQWQQDGVDLPGEDGETYAIAQVAAAHAGAYRCVAQNSGGTATSNAATLTVNLIAPEFEEHPDDVTVTEGQSASFTCEANGTAVTYRWQKNGEDIAGATSGTYTIAAVEHTDAGDYRCVAQNSGGSATSNAATLTVNLIAPAIELHPADVTVTENQGASFTCAASGTLVSYRWQKNGEDIEDATGETYSIATVLHTDAGAYRCIATNSGGSATSNAATLTVNLIAPAIDQQPVDVAVTENQSASFSCHAAGTLVSYRWQKNGEDIAGATGETYAIAAVEYEGAGSYRCIATNSGGSATSNAATLTVNLIAPAITLHPVSLTRTENQSASFSCEASGTAVTYRWQKNGADIAGSSGQTFAIASVQYEDAGSYRCVATNSGGTATSNAATLTVNLIAPAITAQPVDQTVTEGQPASFACDASGTAVTYQWQKDEVDLAGATGKTLAFAAALHTDAGLYRCVAQNSGGTATSDAARLTVNLIPPVITVQPEDVTVTEGESASFTCDASGTLVAFQWQKDGEDIAGATGETFTIEVVEDEDGGSYRCVATNSGGGATSDPAVLTVLLIPPAIIEQPSDVTVTEGAAATFTCQASGTAVSYRWQRNGEDIGGGAGGTLTIYPAAHTDAGSYRCIATNRGGSATSDAATLSIGLNAPAIATHPTDLTVTEGQDATFTCDASGTLVTVRWQKNGADIEGALGETFTITDVEFADAGLYRCVATNTGGSATSQAATLTVNLIAPAITLHPTSVTVTEGGSASFSCDASGTNVSYQWQHDGNDLAGATEKTLAIPAVAYAHAGLYRCVATNTGGSATSNAATLTVDLNAPVITLHPVSLTVTENQSASFSCDASGTNVTYQWQRDGDDIAGGTDKTFTLATVAYTHAGSYRCVATNSGGSATSNTATLTVQLIAPAITVQPLSVSVTERQSASFSCDASGTNVGYRWQKDGGDIAGATAKTFSIAQVEYDDAGSYRCVATNSGGSATSDLAQLIVNLIPPEITQHPASITRTEGQGASFSCDADGTNVSFQWQKDGVDIEGATSETFSIAAVDHEDAGSYRCVATNSGGSASSNAATLTVLLNPPQITTHPQSVAATEGQNVPFTCAASGTAVTYRWQRDAADIAGATGETYTITAVQPAHAGSYRCIATNTGGSATSNAATLTVTPLPPVITLHPAPVTVTEGQPFTLTCDADGYDVAFQWQHDLLDLPGAVAATYHVAQATVSHAGSYACVATNAGGGASSDAATVTVLLQPPVITQHPQSVTVDDGQNATLTCAAQGTDVTYRWQRNGQDVSGANSSVLTFAPAHLTDAGSYRCIATNSGGSATSNAATLTVNMIAPVITQQPQSVTVPAGQTFSLTVQASGGALAYQWQRGGADVPGATSATYSKQAVPSDNGAQYRVIVSNLGGSVTSSTATITVQGNVGPTLTVNNAPQITVTEDSIVITGSAIDNGAGGLQTVITSSRFPGQEFGVTLRPDGSFEGELPLSLGDNVITITATDGQNNSTTQTVTVKVQATAVPRVSITAPLNGAVVTDEQIVVAGFVRSSLPPDQIRLRLGNQVRFPTGSNSEYAFSFPGVPLALGTNVLEVSAETVYGTVSSQVVVVRTAEVPTEPTAPPPVIELAIAQERIFVTGASFQVQGVVRAQTCVQSVTVDGASAQVTGAGTVVTFGRTVTFPANTAELTVIVVARDCNQRSAEARFTAVRDDAAPALDLGALTLAPAVNTVPVTPLRVSGTVSDANLAGLTVNDMSLPALPAGSGSWSFSYDAPLQRASDTTLVFDAWDFAGQRTSKTVVLRLDSVRDLEILSPRDGAVVPVSGSSVNIEVTARAIGLAPDDTVTVAVDGGAPVTLPTAGDYANGALSLPAVSGAHEFRVSVVAQGGAVLASALSRVEFRSDADIVLAVVRQEPAPDASDIEANVPIVLQFNKPVDPAQLEFQVRETAHGKIYTTQEPGADLTKQSVTQLEDVHRDLVAVPGVAQNLPGNSTFVFYPSRDYAYGGRLSVSLLLAGAEVWRSQLTVRALPTLVHGFVADQFSVPVRGVEVQLVGIGRSAITDADGAWSFGFGEPAAAMVPPGHHRALINPGGKRAGYGSLETFVEVVAGQLNYNGVAAIPALAQTEPWRHLQSAQSTPALLASGDVTLDLAQTQLLFPDGQAEGDVHVQFLAPHEIGNRCLASALPDWAYGVQPPGIKVQGPIGITIALPSHAGSFSYIEEMPDLVLLVGVDQESLLITPVGVGRVDRAGQRVVSEGEVALERLDQIGISSAFVVERQELLQRYVAGQIELPQLISGLEAQ